MKIIQSLWSKPATETGGWSHQAFYLMSWALSCLKLKEFYDSVELYTDKKGKELLIDTLQLPYDKVHVVLDDLNEYNPTLWALGKVYTYSLQKEPFLHVDGDVYIWDKFPDSFAQAPLIAQNKEENYEHNILYAKQLVANGFEFEPYLNPRYDPDIIEANAGILGGNDIDFFQLYTNKVFEFIATNKERIESRGQHADGYINTIFEQYFL
ncbi:MAG: hypothetical protein LUF85_02210 [Bacteroides sp.]|nr:hypothetical protein [Bacteroides sp.]